MDCSHSKTSRYRFSLGLNNDSSQGFVDSPRSSHSSFLISPMSSLAIDFGQSSMKTPRRRLSMSSDDSGNASVANMDLSFNDAATATAASVSSASAASFENECHSLSSELNSPAATNASLKSPCLIENVCSNPLGVGFLSNEVDTPRRCAIRRSLSARENDPSPLFAVPESRTAKALSGNSGKVSAKAPFRRRAFSTVNRPMDSSLKQSFQKVASASSQKSQMESLLHRTEDGFDDAFLTGNDQAEKTFSSSLPVSLASLMKGSIVHNPFPAEEWQRQQQQQTSLRLRNSAGLFHDSPSSVRSPAPSLKRLSPTDAFSPKACKKMRAYSAIEQSPSHLQTEETNAERSPLRRSKSIAAFSSPFIDRAYGIGCDESPLIGDFTKPFALPICRTWKGQKAILPQTLVDLISGKFDSQIFSYYIIDCRFPFEFSGGHIMGAKNLYTPDQVDSFFLKAPLHLEDDDRRCIIVFHCEFSSQRGPAQCEFLRKRDRDIHSDLDKYPSLYYPEIYLLDGGYKAFYKQCKEFCEPVGYVPMIEEKHSKDLTLFLRKAKSWSGGEQPGRRTGLRKHLM
eukprot:m.4321 g.4321  ORF g.4321 m.4321 type:complete len:569 (+) comp10540_c0_seq1:101-1807(+)